MSETPGPYGLAKGTCVSTRRGKIPVELLRPGDEALGINGAFVSILNVAPSRLETVKRITYNDFGSLKNKYFDCTGNQPLSLLSCSVEPIVSKSTYSLRWYTSCRRGESQPRSTCSQVSLEDVDIFEAVAASIADNKCSDELCTGFRHIMRSFKTLERCQRAKSLLLSRDFHIIDPHMVRNGDLFSATVDNYSRLTCIKNEAKRRLQLHRVPLGSAANEYPLFDTINVDPYLVGLTLACPAPLNTSGVIRQELGIFDTESVKIPSGIMKGTKITRLQCLAGFIDSDKGHLDTEANTLYFRTKGATLKDVVYGIKDLAQSTGISTAGVFETDPYDKRSRKHIATYCIILTAGAEALNPYIKSAHKRLDESRLRLSRNTSRFKLSDGGIQPIYTVQVEGNFLQLADGLVVPGWMPEPSSRNLRRD